ncbi:MAG: hypothetical protein COC09_01330 [Gammaproteobacteria bacterium]|nr:MAG: hypothetical protein COC09_01330 [Gammaproteobacteria bacterium]
MPAAARVDGAAVLIKGPLNLLYQDDLKVNFMSRKEKVCRFVGKKGDFKAAHDKTSELFRVCAAKINCR